MGVFEQSKENLCDEIIQGMSSMFFGSYIIDLINDRITPIKPSERVSALSGRELIYSMYNEDYADTNVLEEDREDFKRQMAIAHLREVLGAGDHITFVYRLAPRGESFKERWINMSLALAGKDEEYPSKALCITKDITEIKNRHNLKFFDDATYDKKEGAHIEDEAKKNDAKALFLSNMSHEIRTPINGILGMLDIEERYMGDAIKQKECHEKIRTASEHLLSLLGDVLDMNRLENGVVEFTNEQINLSELVDECVVMSMTQAGESNVSISRHRNIRVKHPNVTSSAIHIRQILLNIISNAIKFNKINGRVDVYLKEEEFTGDGVLMTFIVQDTGIGMSQVFLSNIYEPFTQANPEGRSSYNGTGLGMSIVKGIVDQMGGFIDIQSQLGAGSRVSVSIPFTVDPEPARRKEKITEELPNIEGIKALIVEDNDLNMEIAQFIIEDAGGETTLAWNGQEAVDIFADSVPGDFDVILMDIMMPVMDGFKATRAIREMDRADAKVIPIIAMTANTFAEDAKRCLASGMNEHVPKPISADAIARAIVRHVGRG